jgi:hypothetical protein
VNGFPEALPIFSKKLKYTDEDSKNNFRNKGFGKYRSQHYVDKKKPIDQEDDDTDGQYEKEIDEDGLASNEKNN